MGDKMKYEIRELASQWIFTGRKYQIIGICEDGSEKGHGVYKSLNAAKKKLEKLQDKY